MKHHHWKHHSKKLILQQTSDYSILQRHLQSKTMTAETASPASSIDTESTDSGPEGGKKVAIEEKPSLLPLQTKNNTCTGILLLKDQKRFFKLNYPDDKNMDGGGHVMTELEIISECSHYLTDSFSELTEFQQSVKTVALKKFTTTSSNSVTDSYKSFDVQFPHVPKLVRARDMVRLVAEYHSEEIFSLQEHFWAKVVSVTVSGKVTAICVSDLTTSQVKRGDYISFTVDRILGVVHGPYWEYKSSFFMEKGKKKLFEENDIKLVESQAGCCRGKAIEALIDSRGALVQAFMSVVANEEEEEEEE